MEMIKKAIFYTTIILSSIQVHAQAVKDSIPSVLQKRYFHKDARLMLSREQAINNPFSITYDSKNDDGFGLNGLSRSGSIARAITVGNNQDLSLSSSLNLQFSGRLSEDLNVIAAISDDNIPIQPEGNTQQIQDFDKVFIQLIHKNYTLTAGDFEIRKPNSYFLNYFKKAKGGYIQSTVESRNGYKILNDAAIAVAKGKYNRQVFIGKEGIQGPYRLQGSANETYIIVLAGTERVFIDGVLLKRGENQDYTIDYNVAEITFMPKRIITAYSRITIEFEYSDKNYARSLSIVNSTFENAKNTFHFNYYNEQDSKNRPLLQSLDDNQKLFLSTIGDATSSAYYPSIDSVGYTSNEVRYKKMDSLGYSIYKLSTNPEEAIYRLNFTQVGTNNGNYIPENTLANGRVFKWVAPVNGVLQGSYEPVVILVAPKKSSMFTFAAEHRANQKWKMGTEVGISQQDKNLYSTKDDGNNTGLALKSNIENKIILKRDSTGDVHLITNAQAELVSQSFKAVEFYRPVEFNRTFNNTQTQLSAEQWYSVQTAIEKNSKSLVYYRFSAFLKDTVYQGIQQSVGTDYQYKSYRLFSKASLLTTSFNNKKNASNFLKHQVDLSKSFKYSIIGIGEETEKNIFTNSSNDTLANTSFSFYDYKVYVKSPETSINKYLLEYNNRLDRSPYQNDLRSATRSENIVLNTELNKNQNALVGLSVNYRNLNVINKNSTLKSEENIVSRIRFDANALNGFLSSNTFYEIGTGQEPERAFTYLKVPAGQGVYVFRDYNNNGIQELNEFEIAKYTYEADYIRVSTLSTNFVRTKSTSISENINIDPSRRWSNKTNALKYLSVFSNQLNFKIDRKTMRDATNNIFNPFDIAIQDTSLITINTQFRESFYFNRSNPIFGADYTYQGNSNKNLLSIGFDSRKYNEHIIRTRWNIAGQYSILSEFKQGQKIANNEAAADRNYQINYYSLKPEFAYQFSSNYRWAVFYNFQHQENILLSAEKSTQHKLSAEMKYNAGGKSSIQTQFNFIYNTFTGKSNSAIAYEMLEALQPGNNLTWSANWQKNVGPNLQISILYDGRSSEGNKVIHAGSMQARAFF